MKRKIISLRDTSTRNFTFALRITLPNPNYKPNKPKLTKAELKRQWKLNNPIKVAEYKKRWNENNPEYHKDYVRLWYLRNRNRILKVKKERYWKEKPKEGFKVKYGSKSVKNIIKYGDVIIIRTKNVN